MTSLVQISVSLSLMCHTLSPLCPPCSLTHSSPMSTGSMAHVGALLEAVDIYKLNSGKLRSLYERLLASHTDLETMHTALVKEQEV